MQKLEFYEKYKKYSEATYESNLETLGYVDLDNPSSINIYAKGHRTSFYPHIHSVLHFFSCNSKNII